jgi:hypothetical protein
LRTGMTITRRRPGVCPPARVSSVSFLSSGSATRLPAGVRFGLPAGAGHRRRLRRRRCGRPICRAGCARDRLAYAGWPRPAWVPARGLGRVWRRLRRWVPGTRQPSSAAVTARTCSAAMSNSQACKLPAVVRCEHRMLFRAKAAGKRCQWASQCAYAGAWDARDGDRRHKPLSPGATTSIAARRPSRAGQ